MTAYHGGKAKGGEEIANVMLKMIDKIEDKYDIEFRGYWEPFCGMCGVFRHMVVALGDYYDSDSSDSDDSDSEHRSMHFLASDIHPSLILMWKALQNGWTPPSHVSERTYNYYRDMKGSSKEKGYIGFGYSFGGIYFKGYIGKYGRSGYKNRHNTVMNIADTLRDVEFRRMNYSDKKVKGYIIYCDPPYSGESNSSTFKLDDKKMASFDPDEFWDWARKMSKNNLVFISEYTAPKDFRSIYKREITGNRISNVATVERLYVHKSWL